MALSMLLCGDALSDEVISLGDWPEYEPSALLMLCMVQHRSTAGLANVSLRDKERTTLAARAIIVGTSALINVLGFNAYFP